MFIVFVFVFVCIGFVSVFVFVLVSIIIIFIVVCSYIEMKWNEMKWNEMKWNEMKSYRSTISLILYLFFLSIVVDFCFYFLLFTMKMNQMKQSSSIQFGIPPCYCIYGNATEPVCQWSSIVSSFFFFWYRMYSCYKYRTSQFSICYSDVRYNSCCLLVILLSIIMWCHSLFFAIFHARFYFIYTCPASWCIKYSISSSSSSM